MSKTYTLELTADELGDVDAVRGRNFATPDLVDKLYKLAERAKLDRELAERQRQADELHLPWKAQYDETYRTGWYVNSPGPTFARLHVACGSSSERAAKLMSAAPELLEAVKACALLDTRWGAIAGPTRELINRALRKVETGEPE
jgi:hypothetical protein